MTKEIVKPVQCCLLLLLVHVFFTTWVSAQTVTSYSPTKGSTPASLAPGSPAGSYALSGFDTINPYNLSMNFRLPLLSVGGRGEGGYTMMLPIQRKWRINKTVTDSRIGCEACEEHIVTYSINANSDWWHPEIGEFGPGMMAARYSGYNLIPGCSSDPLHWQKALTRLTFTTADGTEYEFRDKNTGGVPLDVPSCNQGASRGRVFVTADGSAATFISDTTIFDAVVPMSADSYFLVSGYLLLRDGTRYRIDEGKVTWIRDRNGNQTRFEPGKIIDPLNREIAFSYEYNGIGILLAKQIGFKGFNGASRTIRIVYDNLGNALRPANAEHPAETVKTYGQLFPGITEWGESGNNAGEEFFTRVISQVVLPDGRSYRFYYNSYAELARVELPTGGAFEYDWTGGVANMGGSFDTGPNYEIYRELVEKRVYNGSTLEGRTILGSCFDSLAPGESCRQVDQVDPRDNNSLLTRTKHFYFGASGPTGLFKEEIHYSKWNEGKEYKTEFFAKNDSTVLRRTEANWVQRAPVPWWSSGSLLLGPEPANDPRISWGKTTLPDVNKVSLREFSYDDALPFNNQSDVYEYEFGTGGPGTLIRRTHTNYVTAANYVGADGLAVYAGTAAHIRSLPSDRWVSSDADGLAKRALTTYEYDAYTTVSHHALLTPRSDITGLCTTFNSTGVCANAAPQDYLTRGNLTGVTSYTQASSQTGPVTIGMQYDVAGNVIKFLDARSIAAQLYYATTIDYSDRFGGPDSEARLDAGALELSGSPPKHTYAFATLITNPLGHTTYSQFDYYLGTPVNAEDENGIVASGRYDDALDRPTQVNRAVNTVWENQTLFAYDDPNRTVTTFSDLNTLNDRTLVSKVLYDPLGRTLEARQYEGASTFIATKTEYDAVGRAFKSSNPYRPQSESTVWTTTAFDGLGRVISVTTPDGAFASTSYSGNTATVTDQAGKKRKSVSDGLGRLVEVYEDPEVPGGPSELNYLTVYQYDVLDNLVKVTQGGQQRFFMYDSLSRLTRARNPEQGTLANLSVPDPITSNGGWSSGYQYDDGGNLTQKTDARGTVSTYAYDRLNRNTSIDYSDTPLNPDVSRLYDGATKGNGRAWSNEAGGTEKKVVSSYDDLGRPLVLQQSFKLPTNTWKVYELSRGYNLAGGVTSQLYPSAHSVTYNYDAAGRLADKDALNPAFKGNLGDGVLRTYSRGVTYASAGQLTQEQFGTAAAVYNKRFYNSRQQLAEILLSTTVGNTWDRGKIINGYSLQCSGASCNATDNNGNLRQQEVSVPNSDPQLSATSWYQQYDYDELNRLKRAHEYTGNTAIDWQQEFDYDRWGNRTINATNTWIGNQNNPPSSLLNETQFEASLLASTNRLQAPGDQALAENERRMRYDTAGNLTNDAYTGAGDRVYDAENRMIKVWGGNNQWQFYTYNADGRRTRRKINNEETWLVYGFDGDLVAEYALDGVANNPTKEYGYRNGQLLITAEPGSTGPTNVALAVNGAVATASSAYDPVVCSSTAASANDGDRTGRARCNGHVWNDAAPANTFPDWLVIDFNGNKTITEIDVVTIQDHLEWPVEPTESMTFSLYGLTSYEVQYWQNSTWVTIPGGSVSGNNKVWRKFTFPAINTSKIRVLASASVDGYSRIVELEAWTGPSPMPRYDLALGATTTASTSYPGWGASGVVNGDRKSLNTYSNGAWSSSGFNNFPESVQVDFGANKTINEIHVFTLQDNWANSTEPTSAMTFTQFGLSGYEVQYWTGSNWVTVPGGSVTGNNKIWRTFTFSPISTSKIRVLTHSSPDGASRVTEIEAYGPSDTAGSGNGVQWLVTDHLGTPRMILDETGELANMTRHDYLPFGEELTSLGLRTAAVGYASVDGVRQLFTAKERDVETGLDYFLARYRSATQGRFISTDPENYQARLTPTDPQAWNGYSYVGNNPLGRTDPNGKGDGWEKFKNAVLHGCRCTDAEIEKKRQADEDMRRQELRDYSQTQGLNGYLIVSGPNGPQAVSIDSLNRSQVVQISQTIRYLYYGIQVEGVGTISHDEALSLISAVTSLPTTIGPTVADQISNGHAWSQHQGEFPGWSQQKFTQKIQETIDNASGSNVRNLSNGRTAYWNAQEGMVVIRDPGSPHGGTAFRPTNGRAYFEGLH